MQDSPIVLTTLAGLSTGLGGLLAVLCPPTERLLAASAGFAGGVMLTASLADLMPEALAFYGGYLPPLACGGAVVSLLALGMLTDRWLYDEWTLTPVNYLRENILNENMLKFGTSPWWYYFTEPFTEGGYVYGPLALVAAVWFFWRRPRHVVTWMLVPFLLVHFFLGHKELRFFFPALFFLSLIHI